MTSTLHFMFSPASYGTSLQISLTHDIINGMEIIVGNILDIDCGIICQQVNCAGGYGAGLSGKISRKYPEVEKRYRKLCRTTPKSELLGMCQPVRVSDKLIIVNIFAEVDYANAYETGIVSTDMDTLVEGLRKVCEKYAGWTPIVDTDDTGDVRNNKANEEAGVANNGISNDKTSKEGHAKVYVPWRIGCGLAGGNWGELCRRVDGLGLPIIAVRLPGAR